MRTISNVFQVAEASADNFSDFIKHLKKGFKIELMEVNRMNIIRVAHNKSTGVYTVTYDNGKTKTFNKITKSIQDFYRQAELFGELCERLNKH